MKGEQNTNREYDMLASVTKETKQLLQDMKKNQEHVLKNIDVGFKRLHEEMVNEFYKNFDHQSFMNMVDRKFQQLSDLFNTCIDSQPGKIFKDDGENITENIIENSDGFKKCVVNPKFDLDMDGVDPGDFITERREDDTQTRHFEQGVCLMGFNVPVR